MTANLFLAALSGILGAGVMTVFIYIFKAAGYNLDIPWLIGTRFVSVENRTRAYTIGMILHLLLGAFWGTFYVFTLVAMAVPPDWPAGIMYGTSHAIFIGAMIGIIATDHPNIGEGKAMEDPGMFGHRWGIGVTVVLLLVHIIFGVSTLLIYNNLL